MKIFNLFMICLISIFMVSCEEEKDNANITAILGVIRINNDRTEIEVDGPITLVLSGASLYKQRESCSGFDSCTAADIEVGDIAEYSYVNHDDTDYANRTINPYEIRFWNPECTDSSGSIQYLLDTDKDGVADINDSAPNDPNIQ